MITDKIAKMGVAVAMLGLCVLTSCSENDGDVASSYSETQTGKPVIRPGMSIAELDTAYLRKVVNEGHGCGSLAKSAVLWNRMARQKLIVLRQRLFNISVFPVVLMMIFICI